MTEDYIELINLEFPVYALYPILIRGESNWSKCMEYVQAVDLADVDFHIFLVVNL